MSATKLSSVLLSYMVRNISTSTLDRLWSLRQDTFLPPCPHLAKLADGRTVELPGKLILYSNGSLKVCEPFGWDGPSPRYRVKFRGRTIFTVGVPLGPYFKGTKLRVTAPATLGHDAIGRHVEELAAALGCSVEDVWAASDLRLRDEIARDWGPGWGRTFYAFVRGEAMFGHFYRRA